MPQRPLHTTYLLVLGTGFNDGTFGRHCHLSVSGLSWPRILGWEAKHTRPLSTRPSPIDHSTIAQSVARWAVASANLLLPAARCPSNQAGGVSVTVPAWPGANLGTSRPMPRTAVLGGAWRPN